MADISPYIVHFLKHSKPNRTVFEQHLKKCHATVVWPEDIEKDALKFICVLSGDDENAQGLAAKWQSEVTSIVRQYLSSLNVKELSTLKEAWAQVMMKLQCLTLNNPDGIELVTKKTECGIFLIGHNAIVEMLGTKISDIIQETEKQVLCTEAIVTKTKKIKSYQIVMIKEVNFIQDMKVKVPNANISIAHTTGEVCFQGSPKDIEIAQVKMLELLNTFVSKKMDLSKEACDMLYVEETKDYIKRKMRKCKVISAWDTVRGEVGITLYGRSDSETTEAVRIIKDSLRQGVINIPRPCKAAFTSPGWTSMINQLVTNNSGRVYLLSKRGSVLLVATDDIFDEIQNEIMIFLNGHFIKEEVISLPRGLMQSLTKFKSTDLKSIQHSLSKMNVSLEENDCGPGMIIKGNPDGVQMAKMKLEKLKELIFSQEHFMSKPGIGCYFSTPKGLDVIKFIEMKTSCIIERKMFEPAGKLHHPVEKAKFVFNDGRKIVVVEGDMTQLKVDAITNSANNDMDHQWGLAKEILDKGNVKLYSHGLGYQLND